VEWELSAGPAGRVTVAGRRPAAVIQIGPADPCTFLMDAHPPLDAHATLVVVGPDDSEHHYAFDALIDDTDGMYCSFV
jgi:hypothetical protein